MNDYNHNGRIDQEDWLIEEEIFQEPDNGNQTTNTGPAFIIVAIIMIGLYIKFL